MSAASESIDVVDVLCHIRQRCESAGSQAEWARVNGFTPAFLGAVLNRTREPSPRMLSVLGLRKITRYIPTRI